MKEKIYLYCVYYMIYCSSHDDFIGVFTTEEQAQQVCDNLNEKFKQEDVKYRGSPIEVYEYPFNHPPYYISKQDVTEWLDYCGEPYTADNLFDMYPEWHVIYQIPSVGKFQLVPAGCTVIDNVKLNEIAVDKRQ